MTNIMLSGADGTGKSTIVNNLQNYYTLKGKILKPVWLRFHHYFAKVVNAIGRVTKKSYQKKYSWGKVGYHDYTGLFGYFYIIAVYFDHIIFRCFIKPKVLKYNPKSSYLIDRYILDIAADLIVDTRNEKLVFKLFSGFVKKELEQAKTFILECPKEIVVKRRPDILDDKKYNDKIYAYDLISKKFNITRLNTGKYSVDEIIQQIING